MAFAPVVEGIPPEEPVVEFSAGAYDTKIKPELVLREVPLVFRYSCSVRESKTLEPMTIGFQAVSKPDVVNASLESLTASQMPAQPTACTDGAIRHEVTNRLVASVSRLSLARTPMLLQLAANITYRSAEGGVETTGPYPLNLTLESDFFPFVRAQTDRTLATAGRSETLRFIVGLDSTANDDSIVSIRATSTSPATLNAPDSLALATPLRDPEGARAEFVLVLAPPASGAYESNHFAVDVALVQRSVDPNAVDVYETRLTFVVSIESADLKPPSVPPATALALAALAVASVALVSLAAWTVRRRRRL